RLTPPRRDRSLERDVLRGNGTRPGTWRMAAGTLLVGLRLSDQRTGDGDATRGGKTAAAGNTGPEPRAFRPAFGRVVAGDNAAGGLWDQTVRGARPDRRGTRGHRDRCGVRDAVRAPATEAAGPDAGSGAVPGEEVQYLDRHQPVQRLLAGGPVVPDPAVSAAGARA